MENEKRVRHDSETKETRRSGNNPDASPSPAKKRHPERRRRKGQGFSRHRSVDFLSPLKTKLMSAVFLIMFVVACSALATHLLITYGHGPERENNVADFTKSYISDVSDYRPE